MTTEVEPYRMIEPQVFTDDELAAVRWRRVPSLHDVLEMAIWYVFCMFATYCILFVCIHGAS